MPADHKEKAFESAIEAHLLGPGGYSKADPKNFDRGRALDPTILLPFIEQTQPIAWQALVKLHGAGAMAILLDDLCKAMGGRGCLDVIRHGFKCYGKQFDVAYFKPAHGLNSDAARLYAANRLTVTRQLASSTKHKGTLDLVLSLNGLPVATAELKNRFCTEFAEEAGFGLT